MGVFQETKVTKCMYAWELSGYRVVASEAPSVQSGGIAVFFREAEHFSMEALQLYGANVIRFYLALGSQQ